MPWTGRFNEALLFAMASGFALVGYTSPAPKTEGFVLVDRGESTIRVVTWNVGGSADDRTHHGVGVALQDEWLDYVAASLRELDPDLAFLQELRDEGQLDQLKRRLGTGWRARITHQGGRRVAVLAQRGTLRKTDFRVGDQRPGVAVIFDSIYHGTLLAVGLHADPYSAQRRNTQIGRAVELLVATAGHAPGLLAGDLNLDLDLGKRRDLFSDNEHLDVESYNYIGSRLFDVGVGRGSTAKPDRRLDYIFINQKLAVVLAGPWKSQRVGSMDHDPVVADLQFLTN